MKSARRTILLLLATAWPAIAGAQGIGKFPGRGAMSGPAREPGVVAPKQVNMVNLLIEHRQELALSDSQFTRIISIKRSLDSANVPSMRKLDSLQRLFRGGPIFSEPSRARRDSIADAGFLVHELTTTVRDNDAEGRDKAYALLSSSQLAKAHDIEAKAEKAIEDDAKKRPD